ncbi:MAG: hypothetical protein E7K06_11290 [Corynebacterium sp.]|uniref:hypothetical protein n=1 Tax=Corynebacterium sp. TaxID=1720 RepID=UPI00280A9136|nr:hypothetical protein [Corynebacterium sp.]MDU3164940.1 hypothetical protein [Corynebacterium sp.]MDU4632862.1 hypothetical protein [Corynebacterium sp.]MDU5328728.1 hypothetical protein [Corynebacterium sp.]MDU6418036.1 hypothetical protein [Corynebacterium sp.]MDU6592278.1 hypothetical protein [Corynebacterium sp.]
MKTYNLDDVKHIADEELVKGERGEFRFIIAVGSCHVPVLLRPAKNSVDALLVTYNGAIQRSKAPDGIVFQRSSWLDEFEATVIQIADPTMLKNRRLQIGWAQFSDEEWAISAYYEVIQALRERFDLVGSDKTLHYGSSAGGFQAVCCAAMDRGSTALVNNPQLDWSLYNERFVNTLLREVFHGSKIDLVRSEQPWRVNVIDLFEYLGYVPKTEVLLNIASPGDVEQQLKPILSRLETFRSLGKNPTFSFNFYFDANMGHNPLGKPYTIQIINNELKNLCSE